METKYNRDLLAEENFLQSAIQDLILDVYTSGMSVMVMQAETPLKLHRRDA